MGEKEVEDGGREGGREGIVFVRIFVVHRVGMSARLQGSRGVVVTLDDDVTASADDVQLSLKLDDGREQPVTMTTTRLNSRALMFTAPCE